MNYSDEIKKHMSDYKKVEFSTIKDGCYRGKSGYKHIFPWICGKLNLIETYRNDFLKDDLSNLRFNRFFHHLNSSQAMCINFLFPLIKEKKLGIILRKLEIYHDEVKYETALFEKDGIEKNNGQRPTNFDFYFETQNGLKLYFEIKYTEDGFGKCKKDNEHLKKYENTYRKLSDGKIVSKYQDKDVFLDNYQIMRNLIHISDDSYLVFIVPKDNKPVYTQATKAQEFVEERYKDKIKVLLWDDLYDIDEENDFSEKLRKHFDEFKKKYKIKI